MRTYDRQWQAELATEITRAERDGIHPRLREAARDYAALRDQVRVACQRR